MSVPVYGIEQYFLNQESGLAYDISGFHDGSTMHTHNFYEFFVVSNGTALHLINNSIQELHEGDFYFIRPSDTHCYNFNHVADFFTRNLAFTDQIFQNISVFLHQSDQMHQLTDSQFPPHIHLEKDSLHAVIRYIEQIGALIKKSSAIHAKYHAQCILALFFEDYFFSHESNQKSDLIPAWLKHLLFDMQKVENFQAGYPRMCELANYTPNHLNRMMKKYTNKTPTEYINEQRLNYSLYLLSQTDMEILKVTETCGFSNLSYFYHLFQKQFKKTPLHVRKGT